MVNKPIISWHIKENDSIMEYEDYYSGSYVPGDTIRMEIQVWNNRNGLSDAVDIDNAYLSIAFEKAEDNMILNFLKVDVEDTGFKKPELEIERAEIELGILSGHKNDGIANTNNKDNYKNISIEITNLPANLKSGLRNMLFNIESN